MVHFPNMDTCGEKVDGWIYSFPINLLPFTMGATCFIRRQMIAYKLFRLRRDGSLGSLFINRKIRLEVGVWQKAESHPTKGFAVREGWHVTSSPNAPHLSMKGRVWKKVEIKDYYEMNRPESQGGKWFIAKRMRIIGDKEYEN